MISKNFNEGNRRIFGFRIKSGMTAFERRRGGGAVWAIVITTALVLAGLFMLPRLNRSNGGTSTGGAPCLVSNLPLLQHIHPKLHIFVDGKEETIPSDIGMGACERAIHMHDVSGEIHVEAQDRHEYTLGEFFATWKKPLEREGYLLEMLVDGAASTELGALKFKDKQRIVLQYKGVIANNADGGK